MMLALGISNNDENDELSSKNYFTNLTNNNQLANMFCDKFLSLDERQEMSSPVPVPMEETTNCQLLQGLTK